MASKVLVHNCTSLIPSLKLSTHVIEGMTAKGITTKMIEKAIEKGSKYYYIKEGTYNYLIQIASGNTLVVGQNVADGYITTAIIKNKLSKTYLNN